MSLEKWRLERGKFFEEWAHKNTKQPVQKLSGAVQNGPRSNRG